MTEPQNGSQPPYQAPQAPHAPEGQAPYQQTSFNQTPPTAGPNSGPNYQAPPPQPLRPDEERTWSLVAHIGTIVLGFIAPLIVLLVKGEQSPTVRANAIESLNFQITVTIGYVASSILMVVLVGFFTFFAIWVLAIVLAIMAAMAASKGQAYKYPFALRLIK
ncbi:DUF4870 domain-containing protein [Kribbella sp. NPDC055071]